MWHFWQGLRFEVGGRVGRELDLQGGFAHDDVVVLVVDEGVAAGGGGGGGSAFEVDVDVDVEVEGGGIVAS